MECVSLLLCPGTRVDKGVLTSWVAWQQNWLPVHWPEMTGMKQLPPRMAVVWSPLQQDWT